jgi:DinB family protein
MDKTSFTLDFKTGRAAWDALLAQLDPAQAETPDVEGSLSAKDVIAHVTWYEREMIGLIEARRLAGSDLWSLSTNARNASIFEQNRARPASDVLAEAHEVGRRLLDAIECLTEDDICRADRFANMPHDWLPWQVIAGNTYDHYPAHIASIKARVARPK